VSYFSDFLYFANLQLPDKTVFLHPEKYAGMAMQRNYFTVLFFLKKSKLLKNGEALYVCASRSMAREPKCRLSAVLKSKNGIPKRNVPSGKTG